MTARRSRTALTLLALGLTVGAGACGGDGGGDTAAYCDAVEKAPALDLSLNGVESQDPEAVRAKMASVRASYQGIVDAAPSEIRDEAGEVMEVVDAVVDAVSEHPDDMAAAADQLREIIVAHPDLAAARSALVEHVADTCEIRLDAPDQPVATSAPDVTATTGG